LHRFTCVYHTHYLAIARLVAARRADPSRSLPRTSARASVRCQGRSLFRPLGSPGGTGGSLSHQRGEQLHEATSCRSNAMPMSGGPDAKRPVPSARFGCVRRSIFFPFHLFSISPESFFTHRNKVVIWPADLMLDS